ncbi:c-type cytochrome [Oceaniglobus roseus]|uniref:c-type cytochrome n=1 Tax=Oceaniglobus roseus TaxID=1737570 RepID=UPI000C7EC634|nr:cytochrome c [Kandeliimicrobium roseum]
MSCTRPLALLAALSLAACAPPPEETGRGFFNAVCAACHGADARGGGPARAGMGQRAPDLTLLAARNAGTFPRLKVMGIIDGYHRRTDPHTHMPVFGDLLAQGDYVGVDTGDGRMTPTPAQLVALVDYLESVQR